MSDSSTKDVESDFRTADIEVTRHDNHLIMTVSGNAASQQLVDANQTHAVISFGVRAPSGATIPLHRDGSLVYVSDASIGVAVSGVDPQSVISVNNEEVVADITGRSLLHIPSVESVEVDVVLKGTVQSVQVSTRSQDVQTLTQTATNISVALVFVAVLLLCMWPQRYRARSLQDADGVSRVSVGCGRNE